MLDSITFLLVNRKSTLLENGTRKGNTQLAKMLYVYKGKREVSSPRKALFNPHYFCGTYCPKPGNQAFFEEVSDYWVVVRSLM